MEQERSGAEKGMILEGVIKSGRREVEEKANRPKQRAGDKGMDRIFKSTHG